MNVDGPKGNSQTYKEAWVRNFEWEQCDRDVYETMRTGFIGEGRSVEEAEHEAYRYVQEARRERQAKEASPVDVYKFVKGGGK